MKVVHLILSVLTVGVALSAPITETADAVAAATDNGGGSIDYVVPPLPICSHPGQKWCRPKPIGRNAPDVAEVVEAAAANDNGGGSIDYVVPPLPICSHPGQKWCRPKPVSRDTSDLIELVDPAAVTDNGIGNTDKGVPPQCSHRHQKGCRPPSAVRDTVLMDAPTARDVLEADANSAKPGDDPVPNWPNDHCIRRDVSLCGKRNAVKVRGSAKAYIDAGMESREGVSPASPNI